MRVKIIFGFCLFFLFLFSSSVIFACESQETTKKALDAFINATTKSTAKTEPVAGAEVTVVQIPGPAKPKKYVTDKEGKFMVEEVELVAEKIERARASSAEITFRMTVKPPANFPYKLSPGASNVVTVKVKKSDGPKFEFVLLWEHDPARGSNRGGFAVSGASVN